MRKKHPALLPKNQAMRISSKYFRIPNLSVLVFVLGAGFLLHSCKVYRPSYVFQDIVRDTTISIEGIAPSHEDWIIKTSDQLLIHVSSLNPEEDRIFNAAEGLGSDKSGIYAISKEGNIFFHKLGSVSVEGLTRMGVKEKLEKALQPYLKDPILTIGFANHYVTVIGEVGMPRKINLNNDKANILDVLAETGKGSADVNMNKLMVIREKSGSRNFKTLNLQDPSVFNSDFFFMQPGDIVVVKPNEEKVMAEAKRLRTQQVTTLTLQAVTIALIVYQTFFRK